jgi:hypothetical protein
MDLLFLKWAAIIKAVPQTHTALMSFSTSYCIIAAFGENLLPQARTEKTSAVSDSKRS